MIMARDDPNGGAPTLAAAPSSLFMRQIWDGKAPKRYLIRVIDIEEVRTRDGPELRASFRDPRGPEDLRAGGIKQAIQEAARKAGPKRSFLSRAKVIVARARAIFKAPTVSPLDIALYGGPTIIVFILARPINLRFSPLVKALSHKNPADRDGYGGLTHVSLARGKYYESPEPLQDCRIVYFVCEPPPNPLDPLPPPPPPDYGYKHGLNLNVRLNHPPEGDKTQRVLDIMIDPDIRYPGQ
jgi:hypothetical protein